MKALISPLEPVATGFRVCQAQDEEFPIAEPFFWLDVPDDTGASTHFYDPIMAAIVAIPTSEFISQQAASDQPSASGLQTL